MSDTLSVVNGLYDESTGIYVNDELYKQIHPNDRHYIPDVLMDIMIEHNITRIEKILMDKKHSDAFGGEEIGKRFKHPEDLEEYRNIGEFRECKVQEKEGQ